MNIEQKTSFDLTSFFIKPLLKTLYTLLGEYIFEFLKEKIAEIKDEDGEVTLQGDPNCTPPQIYNPVTKKCVDPIRK